MLGVPRVLPPQRRRVLRQLLRLLPARGLHPPHRHLHREGLHPQRRDRPPAHQRDAGAAHPARRGRGRQRLVHLRHRRARGLAGRVAGAQGRRLDAARHPPASPGAAHVRAPRHRLRALALPGPRRHRRHPAGLRGDRDPPAVLRRRGRAHPRVRPPHRRDPRRARAAAPVPGGAVHHQPGQDARGVHRHRGGAGGALRVVRRPGQAAGVPAPAAADHVRPRDDARDRHLRRHRELLRVTCRAGSRARPPSP